MSPALLKPIVSVLMWIGIAGSVWASAAIWLHTHDKAVLARGIAQERERQAEETRHRNADVAALNAEVAVLRLKDAKNEPQIIEKVVETVLEVQVTTQCVPTTALPASTLKAIDNIGR